MCLAVLRGWGQIFPPKGDQAKPDAGVHLGKVFGWYTPELSVAIICFRENGPTAPSLGVPWNHSLPEEHPQGNTAWIPIVGAK